MRGIGLTKLLELTKLALRVWSEQKHRLEHFSVTFSPQFIHIHGKHELGGDQLLKTESR